MFNALHRAVVDHSTRNSLARDAASVGGDFVPPTTVVLHEGLESICSYDRDFDRIREIVRTQP